MRHCIQGALALGCLSCAAALYATSAADFLNAGTYYKRGDGVEEIVLDGTKDAPSLSIEVCGGTLRLNQKKHRDRVFAELSVSKGCTFEHASTWSSAVTVVDALRGGGDLRFLAHTSGKQVVRHLYLNGAADDFTGLLAGEGPQLHLTPKDGHFGGSIAIALPKKGRYMGGLSIEGLGGMTIAGSLTMGEGTTLEIRQLPLKVGAFQATGQVLVNMPASALEGESFLELSAGQAEAATAAKLSVAGFRVEARGTNYILAERQCASASKSTPPGSEVNLAEVGLDSRPGLKSTPPGSEVNLAEVALDSRPGSNRPSAGSESRPAEGTPASAPSAPSREPGTFTLLSWNVYQQGTQQKGGYEMIINELVRLKPDLAVLVEVRNYGKKDWLARVVADLAARGETYYTHWSEGAGVLSRTPFEDTVIWPGPRGNVRKAVTTIGSCQIALYAGHLDASYCAYYNVYPYAGKTLTAAERDAAIAKILKTNVRSDRDNMAYAFLNDARQEQAAGRNILFCGDFNETSHLDWTDATKNLRSHNGFVIPWTVSMALEGDGYIDAYRKRYPNPVTHPCTTYPSAMDGVDPKRIAWDKQADERERIDFIHYKGKGIALKEIKVYGPRDSVGYGKIIRETGDDPFLEPLGSWPSDHKGLWAKFSYQ